MLRAKLFALQAPSRRTPLLPGPCSPLPASPCLSLHRAPGHLLCPLPSALTHTPQPRISKPHNPHIAPQEEERREKIASTRKMQARADGTPLARPHPARPAAALRSQPTPSQPRPSSKVCTPRPPRPFAPSRAQVGTGSRSEKIRTYNYKDSRCTDHRLSTNFPLDSVLSGEIEPIVGACIAMDQQEMLEELQDA